MAKYIVLPRRRKDIAIVKCHRCRTMYVPETKTAKLSGRAYKYEECPVCGCGTNDDDDTISLWQYNLIKWLRGGFRHERPEDSGGDG